MTFGDPHIFDLLTRACSCGVMEAQVENSTLRKPAPTHDDGLNPGTVAASYTQRSTGRVIHYRKRN